MTLGLRGGRVEPMVIPIWTFVAAVPIALVLGFLWGLETGLRRNRLTKDWLALGWRRHWYVEVKCRDEESSPE